MRSWIVVALGACGPSLVTVVPDGASTGGSVASSDPTFEVAVWTAKDPLPVSGASVSFVNLKSALGQAVIRNVRPRHDATLTVELVAAEATYAHARLDVALDARVTLRAREGNAFIAQTQAVCRESAIVAAAEGAPVVWACMTKLGRDVGRWIEGVQSQGGGT